MENWDQNRLLNLINTQQEENTQLEYKSAAALELTDSKRSELRKDISAMANSAGGVIIYGMIEQTTSDNRAIPVSLDNVAPVGTKIETIYQLLDSVDRHIDGIKVSTIDCPSINGYVYVVEVPESNTIHMAEGGTTKNSCRYFKRRGNGIMAMEDYEVRMGLNRSVHPYFDIKFLWGNRSPKVLNRGRDGGGYDSRPRLTVRVIHSGGPLAEKLNLLLEIPGFWQIEPQDERHVNVAETQRLGLDNFIRSSLIFSPIFPEQDYEWDIPLRSDFWTGFTNSAFNRTMNGHTLHQDDIIKWTLWADSATPRRGEITGGEIAHESTQILH